MYLIILLCISIHSCYIGSKVVISLLALEFGASQVLVGVIAALYALVPLMLGVYSGRLADTIGMRIPLLAGAALVACAMLTGHLWHSLSSLFAIAVLVGAGFVFFNVSIQNLTGTHGTADQHVRNFSMLSIGYSTSTFIGPMVAGFVIDYAGHATAFLVFTVFALVPIAVITLNRNFAKFETAGSRKEQRRALDLLRIPPVRRLIIISGLIVAASDLFAFYVPVYAHSTGLTASTIGVILGVYAVAAFLPRFMMPVMVRRWKAERVLFIAMLIGALGFVAFPLSAGVSLLMACSAVIGIGLGCGQPLSMMMSYEQSPAGRSGEVTGMRLTANNVARVVIPIMAGTVGAAFGTSPVFWANAVNLVGISYLIRREHHQPRSSQEGEEAIQKR